MSINKKFKTVPLIFSWEPCGVVSQKVETNLKSPRNCKTIKVQAETGQKRKRKADAETETPRKRQRTDIGNTGKATKVSVIDLTKTSDEELPVKQAPTTTKKRNVAKPRPPKENSLFSINTSRGEHCGVVSQKVETNLQSPRNCQTIEVQAETGQKRKRKDNAEIETPSKRQRTDIGNTGKATKVSVIDLTKTSDEELPVKQAPTTTKKRNVAKPRPSKENPLFSINTSRGDFEAKYVQNEMLGEGGFGSVYAGFRTIDGLPVAIKHIQRKKVIYHQKMIKKVTYKIPLEVLTMQMLAAGDESLGKSAAVSLLEWYNLPKEVLLVMERPVPCVNLTKYLTGLLDEHQVKDIMKQMVDAAIEMDSKTIFHRDIKSENVLIEQHSAGPRVRIIDFGCSCFVKKNPFHQLCGTKRYFPPEFFTTETYEAVPTTVWQLGALQYEMLTNQIFETKVFLKAPYIIRTEVEALNVTQDCKDLLRKCLRVSPTERITLEQMKSHPWLNPPPNPQPTPGMGPVVQLLFPYQNFWVLQVVPFDQNRLNPILPQQVPHVQLHRCH